jgi:sterol desaturase/sphingolipid hydroxylase (fatty acid hydroxylase superfamily)
MKWFSSSTFSIYRIILGLYLSVHFIHLYFDGTELFSNQGVIPDASILPTYGKIPVFMFYFDDPSIVSIFMMSLIISSILFTFGIYRRLCAAWLFYGWMSLLNRNPLISNPSLGYIGWILLACSCIPKGERLNLFLEEDDESDTSEKRWEMPDVIYYGMWIIMGISYTASGFHKLQCQTWRDGTALYYVLTGPLARPNSQIVTLLISNMNIIKLMTYGSLFMEISYLFLGTFCRLRKYYWISSMAFHLGILMTVNFSDLTMGMIMAHLFTFDPEWFYLTKELVIEYDWNGERPAEMSAEEIYEASEEINKSNEPNKINSEEPNKINSEEPNKINSEEPLENNSFVAWNVIAIIIIAVCILINSKGGLYQSIYRLTQLTMDMYFGFGIVIAILGVIMILERIFPARELKKVEGWWKWVVIINCFQLFAVILATFTWENWLQNTSYFTSATGFHLRDHVTPFWGGYIAYIFNQWLFYHWHKARHEVYFCWILFHQFHHSPTRIEAITSFYKHPLEIVADSFIMAWLLYSVLGLSNESSIWLSIFSGIGEYIYHMNIRTPYLMGFIFQRPESHWIHHMFKNRINSKNLSDFPPLDYFGKTLLNPKNLPVETGFGSSETKRIDMLLFKDVVFGNYQKNLNDPKKLKKILIRYIWYGLVIWGSLNSTAFMAHDTHMRDIGFATVSSPLPLVFSSFNGVETFVTDFNATIKYDNGTILNSILTVDHYGHLEGSYNRRNVYGAIFSHGPFFDANTSENLITIRQGILNYSICRDSKKTLMDEFGFSGKVHDLKIDVLHRPTNHTKIGELYIKCA